ncbi:MAG: Dabb family protein [Acidovorax sp.]|nr:Dabb family protein [Acidovorax sp.]
MYMHIVMLEFTPGADPAFLQQVQAYAVRVRQECEGVRLYHFGPNEAARAQGYTHAVVSLFDDSATHDAYQISPAHVAMKTYMGPCIRRLAVFDGAALLS